MLTVRKLKILAFDGIALTMFGETTSELTDQIHMFVREIENEL